MDTLDLLESFNSFLDLPRDEEGRARLRDLLESGFSGIITDKAGRKRKYVNGKPVAMQAGSAATTGAQAKKKAKRLDPPTPQEKTSFVQKLKSLATTVKGIAKNVAERVGTTIWNRMTEPEKQVTEKAWAVAKGLYVALESPRHKLEQMATEVAKERGLPETHVKKVSSVLASASIVEQWVTNIPATHHALHELHIDGVAGFALAKVGALVPVAALGYLIYSSARNPFATLKAAKKVLTDTHMHESVMESKTSIQDVKDKTALLLERADRGDWYFALLSMALDQTKDLNKAIDMADKAFAKQPEEPT